MADETDSLLVTQAEYARHRGVGRSAIAELVRRGRITLVERDGRKLVDVAAADRALGHARAPYGNWVTVAELAQRERISPQVIHKRVRRFGGIGRGALIKVRSGPRGCTLVDLLSYERLFGEPEPTMAPLAPGYRNAGEIMRDAFDKVLAENPVPPFADPPAAIADQQRSSRELFGEAVTLLGVALRGALANVCKRLTRAASSGRRRSTEHRRNRPRCCADHAHNHAHDAQPVRGANPLAAPHNPPDHAQRAWRAARPHVRAAAAAHMRARVNHVR
jgi:hypothetical protein